MRGVPHAVPARSLHGGDFRHLMFVFHTGRWENAVCTFSYDIKAFLVMALQYLPYPQE